MLFRIAAFVCLLFILPAGAQETWLYQEAVPRVLSVDLFLGSAYFTSPTRARSAAHLFRIRRAFVAEEEGRVICLHSETDSAVMAVPRKPRKILQQSARTPTEGERVIVAGWRGGVYLEAPAEYLGFNPAQRVGDGATLPAYLFQWWHLSAKGMSGGPVIDAQGRAIATISAYGVVEAGAYIAAVPLAASGCP